MRRASEVVERSRPEFLRLKWKVGEHMPLRDVAAQHSRLSFALLNRHLELNTAFDMAGGQRGGTEELAGHSFSLKGVIAGHLHKVRMATGLPSDDLCTDTRHQHRRVVVGVSAFISMSDDDGRLEFPDDRHPFLYDLTHLKNRF